MTPADRGVTSWPEENSPDPKSTDWLWSPHLYRVWAAEKYSQNLRKQSGRGGVGAWRDGVESSPALNQISGSSEPLWVCLFV